MSDIPAGWTAQQILDLEVKGMGLERYDIKTIRDFFVRMAMRVWEEDDGFSGKRPFGFSDWRYDLYDALYAAKVITVDPADDDFDYREADPIIWEALKSLGGK